MGSDLPRVVSLPRKDPSDDQKDFLLVHVTSTGASPLDLKLIGTDETDVFSVSCKLAPGSTTRPGPLDLQIHALVRGLIKILRYSNANWSIEIEKQKSFCRFGRMGKDIDIHSTWWRTK
jgi:hypothetical protein